MAEHTVPAAIGAVFCLLVLLAFWFRMELSRFLRYRTSVLGSMFTALVCGALCVLAIWSTPDFRKPPFGPGDALISTNATINDLAMNTTYKTMYSILLPYFNRLQP